MSWGFFLRIPGICSINPKNPHTWTSFFLGNTPVCSGDPNISHLRILFFLGNASICSVDYTRSQIFPFQYLIFPWKQPSLLC